MRDDLIDKIKNTISKKKQIQEEDVRSLMILIRKVLDDLPDQNHFLTIRLFCNWSAHNSITQSNSGLRILAEINDVLVTIKDSSDIFIIRSSISQAIGFSALRSELNEFFRYINVECVLVLDNEVWIEFLCNLIEIIRDVPLSFPSISKLDKTKRKIYDEIAKNPIKPGAGVVSIVIRKIYMSEGGFDCINGTMSLQIITEDTTSLVIPLLIDARL